MDELQNWKTTGYFPNFPMVKNGSNKKKVKMKFKKNQAQLNLVLVMIKFSVSTKHLRNNKILE